MEEFIQFTQEPSLVFTVIWCGVFALAALGFGWTAYSRFRAYRIVQDTPTANIRSAPQGYVEIKGMFTPLDENNPRKGPFSGKPCVWYRAWMEEKVQSGKRSNWKTIYEEQDPRPCLLKDGTGHCAVMASEADIYIATVKESWHPDSWFNDPPEPLTHVDTGLFERDVRFTEERLESGPGYAVGHFSTINQPPNANEDEGSLAAKAAQALSRWRDDYMAEVNGRPDEAKPNKAASQMWDHTKKEAVQGVAGWLTASGVVDDDRINVLGPTGESRRPFIVGNGHEEEVGSRLGWQALGCAIGFVVLATVVTAFLLGRYGVLG